MYLKHEDYVQNTWRKTEKTEIKWYKPIEIVRNFNISLSIHRIIKQKIGKNIEEMNSICELDFINIFRAFYLTITEYILFKTMWNIHKMWLLLAYFNMLTHYPSLTKKKKMQKDNGSVPYWLQS